MRSEEKKLYSWIHARKALFIDKVTEVWHSGWQLLLHWWTHMNFWDIKGIYTNEINSSYEILGGEGLEYNYFLPKTYTILFHYFNYRCKNIQPLCTLNKRDSYWKPFCKPTWYCTCYAWGDHSMSIWTPRAVKVYYPYITCHRYF